MYKIKICIARKLNDQQAGPDLAKNGDDKNKQNRNVWKESKIEHRL